MNINKLSDLKDCFCHLTLKWRIFIKSVLSRDQSGFSTTEIRIRLTLPEHLIYSFNSFIVEDCFRSSLMFFLGLDTHMLNSEMPGDKFLRKANCLECIVCSS